MPRSRARGGRSNTCRNNMRNLAVGVSQFEKQRGWYPGYVNEVYPREVDANGNHTERSWAFMVLPYLERNDIYEPYTEIPGGGGIAGSTNWWNNPLLSQQLTQCLDIMLCPSDSPQSNNAWPQSSFAVNVGLPDVPPLLATDPPADWPANGVFHDLRRRRVRHGNEWLALPVTKVTEQYIADGDGTTNTILLTENVDALSWTLVGRTNWERQLGVMWNAAVESNPGSGNPPRPHPPDSMRINRQIGGDPDAKSVLFARPSSNHPGVVNVAYCDTHVSIVSQEIDYRVWCQLMTPRDRETQFPGTMPADPDNRLDPAYPHPLFHETPIREPDLE
jgi:prepilin-type processing-associated H-X9-DG protein